MKKQKKLVLTLMVIAATGFLFTNCDNAGKQSAGATETAATTETAPTHNMLSEAEKTSGWMLLFDGKSLDGWHGWKQEEAAGWAVEDGVLTNPGEGAVDLVSNAEYSNFEMVWDWKVTTDGNSGLMYRVVEADQYEHPWATGPEYQLLDDFSANFKEGYTPAQFAAANYDMEPPSKSVSKPTGEWNEARLVVNGNHVEHWLNGEKVIEYEFGSEKWQEQVQNCKWKGHPDYGKASSGLLAYQGDHSRIWLRNVKIKTL